MNYTINISSKGQIVLPISIRKSLASNVLSLNYNERKKEITIKKIDTISDLRTYMKKALNGRKVEPLLDPRAFYNKRKPL